MTPGRGWFDHFDRSTKTPENAADATELALLELAHRLNGEMTALEARLASDGVIEETELQEKRIALLALFDMQQQAAVRYTDRSEVIDTKALKGAGTAAVPGFFAASALLNSGESKELLGVGGALGAASAVIALYARAAKLIRDIDNRAKANAAVGTLESKLDTL